MTQLPLTLSVDSIAERVNWKQKHPDALYGSLVAFDQTPRLTHRGADVGSVLPHVRLSVRC